MHDSLKTKTNNSLLQKEKEVIKNSFLQLPSSKTSFTDTLVSKQSCLISQNKPTIHTPPNSQPLTKTHASDTIVSSHAYSDSHIIKYSHAYRPGHKSLNTKDKNSNHHKKNRCYHRSSHNWAWKLRTKMDEMKAQYSSGQHGLINWAITLLTSLNNVLGHIKEIYDKSQFHTHHPLILFFSILDLNCSFPWSIKVPALPLRSSIHHNWIWGQHCRISIT